jgi:hypothetical protein
MANQNFVVHNGLTVGPLTIDAASGNITTSGVIAVTGGGGFAGISSNQIYQNASNVTATTSYVNVAVNSSNIGSFSSGGLYVNGTLFVTGNITTTNYEFVNVTEYANTIAANTLTVATSIYPTANATINLGTLTNQWSTIYGKATTAQYADLAENYQADAIYTPGTVLAFGGLAEVTISSADMDIAVAGVVSTNPAYLMNSILEGEYVATVALTGRVPTRVTGPIKKGDMLVSNGDGRARAETVPRVGSVIGKAIEDFNSEDGVIEVVVGKH